MTELWKGFLKETKETSRGFLPQPLPGVRVANSLLQEKAGVRRHPR